MSGDLDKDRASLQSRVAAIVSREGLNLEIDATTTALIESGAASIYFPPDDATLIDRVHMLNSKRKDLQIADPMARPINEERVAMMAWLGPLASDWERLAPSKKLSLLSKFRAEKAALNDASPLARYEAELKARYGDDYESRMNGRDRMRLGDLRGRNGITGAMGMSQRNDHELASLKNALTRTKDFRVQSDIRQKIWVIEQGMK